MIINIIYEANPPHKDIELLGQGIAGYAKEARGQEPIIPYGFFLRDDQNETKGGCNGVMFYGCLYIDQLWVEDSLRHQGYGVKLMQAAEKLGQKNNCLFATVNTMDWEALDFYKKLGYHVEFERKGFSKNSIFYFMRKDF